MQFLNSKRKKWLREHGWFWVGGTGLAIGSFVTLRTIIDNTSDHKSGWLGTWPDYSHEIASAVLGSILTLAFTALLLRAQTESSAELQKQQIKAQTDSAAKLQESQIDAQTKLQESQARAEKERESSVKFFEEKIKIYGELLKGLEDFLQDEKLADADADFTKLTLTCLHVSYIADSKVLAALEELTFSLLDIIREDSEDIDQGEEHNEGHDPITHAERKTILSKFGEVATTIKTDLNRSRASFEDDANRLPQTQRNYDAETKSKEENRLNAIQNIIDNLSLCSIAYSEAERRLKRRKKDSSRPASLSHSVSSPTPPHLMNKEEFAARSQPDEARFYAELFEKIEAAGHRLLWTERGFSIERTVKFYPSSTLNSDGLPSKNVINRPASQKRIDAVENELKRLLKVEKEDDRTFCHQNIKFAWENMNAPKAQEWADLIEKVVGKLPEQQIQKAPVTQ